MEVIYRPRITLPRHLKRALFWVLPLGFLGLFFFTPLFRILSLALSRSEISIWAEIWQLVRTGSSFTGGTWGEFWALVVRAYRLDLAWSVLGFTFWQAFLSTLLTLAVGLPGAYLFARYDFRGKRILRAVTGIPFVMPTLVVASGFIALLGPQGWVNQGLMAVLGFTQPPIQFLNTLGAILLAHVFYNTTIVLRMVGDYWAYLDPRLEQAARTLGARGWQVFLRITLPMLAPAILAASLLVFIFDFSSFAVVLVLGGPRFSTLETEIYYQTSALFNLPVAAMLSILQLTCTLMLTVIYSRLSARVSRPMTRRPLAITQARLNTWRRRIVAGLIGGFLLVLLATPMLALAARSVTYIGPERTREGIFEQGITLRFYQALAENQTSSALYASPVRAIAISLGYAAATVVLALGLGLPAAWALTQHPDSRLNRLLDPLLMLPLGTSAVTLGLGFLITFNQAPLDLRASPLLIPLAHTLVAFPFVVRSLTPALRSIQPRLRAAAAMLGASPWQVWKHIDLPLIARAVLVAGVFAFTISLGEFGASALLARPEYPTLPSAIYRLLARPGALNYGQGLALSTILMAVTGAAMFAMERFRIGDQEF